MNGTVGVAASGFGLAGGVALVAGMEAAVPIPIPSDLLLLALGERAGAGAFPLWAAALGVEAAAVVGTVALFAVLRRSGRALVARFGSRLGLTPERVRRATSFVEGRGTAAVALGRMTPGLRTLTVLASSASAVSVPAALAALLVGSTVFVQGHLLLGFVAGPPARELVHDAGLVLVAVVLALAAIGLVVWLRRRRGRAGFRSWAEASCPACLVIGAVAARDEARPLAAASEGRA